jgi:hypothetical protein
VEFRSKFIRMLVCAGMLTAAAVAQGGGVAQATPDSHMAVKPLAGPGVFSPLRNLGRSLGPNMCLQPVSPVVSSPVVQQHCDGSLAQGWQFIQTGTNHYRFLNQLSGLCLFAFIDPAANGNPMGLNTCRTVSNEEFNAGRSLPDIVSLESRTGFRDTGFCLDVPGGASTDGLQMQLWQCNGTAAQRWVVGFE